MRLRWTTPATQDLYNIIRHIQRDNPNAAAKVAETLYEDAASCWISLVRAAGDASKEPENWCSGAVGGSLTLVAQFPDKEPIAIGGFGEIVAAQENRD